jgi:uncharacterized protein (DUF362 family)
MTNIFSKNISRRNFLKKCGQTGGLIATSSLLPSRLLSSTVNSDQYDLVEIKGNPENTVKQAFKQLGGIEKFIRLNDTVLIKPNASFPSPSSWGATTNPKVIKTVANLSIDAGAKRVIIADYTMRKGDVCFVKSGLKAEIENIENCKIIPLEKESYFREVAVPNGEALKLVKIAKLIEKSDVLINIPCAKSHSATEVSFGLKNLMGLIWDRQYFHNSTDLHQAIAELATIIRPHLTILDATRLLVTGGPTGPGKVQELNTIIAGTDPLAVDAYAVTLANWNNRSLSADTIKHLVHASDIGIGEINLEKLLFKKTSV